MSAPLRTIRLFVSSTFLDMKAERDLLHRQVFPRLRRRCLSRGLRFQPLDLRWGVPEEAGNDNRTMRICLRELRRCQEGRPKPNFLILLGDRYGWRPLPETIPADLFTRLRDAMPAALRDLLEWREAQATDAKGWYRRDDNAVPPVYELRPRGSVDNWDEDVEKPLLHALETAASRIGVRARARCPAIGTSATEQEIVEGALNVEDARHHVHAFIRNITGLPRDPWRRGFVDVLDDGTRDPAAQDRLSRLKARIESKIGARNVHRYAVPWSDGGLRANDLAAFAKDVYAALKGVIDRQIAELTSTSRRVQEEEAHRAFGDERCRGFVGRTAALGQIASGMRRAGCGAVAVVGPAGAGKSALMAEAVRRARTTYGDAAVLARFIGATPESTNLLSLAVGLVEEIRARYPSPPDEAGDQPEESVVPLEIGPLIAAFHEAIARPTARRPLFIFLDALDQLAPSHGALELHWLPGSLNRHVRFVVSAALPASTTDVPDAGVADPPTLAVPAQDPRGAVMAALERRASEIRQVHLRPLSTRDGRTLIARWLADAGRTLPAAHQEAVIGLFAKRGNPLWLRVAIGECRRVASWEPLPDLDPDLPGLIRQILGRLSAEEEHGAVLVRSALAYLASSRHGLAEDEMMDLLSADRAVMTDFRRRFPRSPRRGTLPIAVWVRLHGDLAPYLSEHAFHNAALMRFYHRSFQEAVQSAFLDTDAKRRAAHRCLADFFGARNWSAIPVERADRHAVRELAWQRCQAGDDPELAALLAGFEYVAARARDDSLSDLEADFDEVLTALRDRTPGLVDQLAAHRRWVASAAHALRWYAALPGFAAQQAFNEAQETAVVSAAEEAIAGHEGPMLLRRAASPATPGPTSGVSREWFDQSQDGTVVALAPDLRWCASLESQLCVRDLARGDVRFSRPTSGRVLAAASDFLVCETADDDLEVLDPTNGVLIARLTGHEETVNGVAILPSSRRIVTTADDKTLRLWDLRDGRMLACWNTDEHECRVAALGEASVATAGLSGTVRVWDLERGEVLYELHGPSHQIHAIAAFGGGRGLATGDSSGEIRVWDLPRRECRTVLKAYPAGEVYRMAVDADGRRAVSADWDSTAIVVWDLQRGVAIDRLEKSAATVSGVDISPDGSMVLSGDWEGVVRLWHVPEQAPAAVEPREGAKPGHDTRQVFGYAWDDRRQELIAATDRATLETWDLASETWTDAGFRESDGVAVAVTPGGRRVLSADHRGLTCFDGQSKARVARIEAGLDFWDIEPITGALTVSGDGRLAVVFGEERGFLFDVGTHRLVRRFDNGLYFARTLPNAREVAGAGRSYSLVDDHEWDFWTIIAPPGFALSCVAVAPDCSYVVTGGTDGTLCIEVPGSEGQWFDAHQGRVVDVWITPDALFVVSVGRDGVQIRRLADGELLAAHAPSEQVLEILGMGATGELVLMTRRGRLNVLRLSGLERGPDTTTATREWLFGADGGGTWADAFTALCSRCGGRSLVPEALVHTIRDIENEHGSSPLRSCLEIAPAARALPQLLGSCPRCGAAWRFNPFLADNREWLG